MKIHATLDDRELSALLRRLKEHLADLQPTMEELGQRYERRLLEGWEKEQAPDGTPWAPSKILSNYLGYTGTTKGGKRQSAYTSRGGLRAGFARYLANKKTLVLTGRMRSRLHYQAGRDSLAIGIAGIPYAAIHQFGGRAGRGRKVFIPARPWLAVNRGLGMVLADRDRAMALDILGRRLERAAAPR